MTRPIASARDHEPEVARDVQGEPAGLPSWEERGDGRWVPWNEDEGMLEWGPATADRRPRTD